jgi:hypothetical protein
MALTSTGAQAAKTILNIDNPDTSSAHDKLLLIAKIEAAGGRLPVQIGEHYIFSSSMNEGTATWVKGTLTYNIDMGEFVLNRPSEYPKLNKSDIVVYANGKVKASFFYVGWRILDE